MTKNETNAADALLKLCVAMRDDLSFIAWDTPQQAEKLLLEFMDKHYTLLDAAVDKAQEEKTVSTKLKLRVLQIERLVVVQVLKQPDKTGGRGALASLNGDRLVKYLRSCGGPQLTENFLFLRGDQTQKDLRPAYLCYEDAEQATEAIGDIRELVKQFNATVTAEPKATLPTWEIIE